MASFAPETLITIGSFPVTNTVVNTIFVDIVILSSVYALKKNLSKIPHMFQNIIEYLIDSFYKFAESIAGENAKKIFPFFMSFFLFILISNWSGLIPGSNTVGFSHRVDGKKEFVPLMRNQTSDLNLTFALALISLVATHVLSIKTIGIKDYLSRYFSFNPIYLFVGVLEIISEITKLISLSFRLFGNIYAGEVVLATISSLFAFLFPIPFMLLEVVVGLVQALVFSILTMAFMSILMTPHHAKNHSSEEVMHT